MRDPGERPVGQDRAYRLETERIKPIGWFDPSGYTNHLCYNFGKLCGFVYGTSYNPPVKRKII